MPSVKPSDMHPWGYKARHGVRDATPLKEQKRPLQVVLTGIIENWPNVRVPLVYRGRFDSYSLIELPDNIVATWLIKTVRQYTSSYVSSEEEDIEQIPFED